MPRYEIEFEGTMLINAEDEEQAEFFSQEELSNIPTLIYDIVEVKEFDAS